MENEFIKISQSELKRFEMDLRKAGIVGDDEKVDKINLVVLYKLREAEQKIVRLEKHVMTPLIH